MAKSDSDSNGLRQDQPECCRGKPRQARESHSGWRVSVGHNERGQPDITKPSRLTSDPICTADRRGGILISFGPVRKPRWALSPSKRVRSRWREPSADAERESVAAKAKDRPAIRRRTGTAPGRRTHYTRIAGYYIRASNRNPARCRHRTSVAPVTWATSSSHHIRSPGHTKGRRTEPASGGCFMAGRRRDRHPHDARFRPRSSRLERADQRGESRLRDGRSNKIAMRTAAELTRALQLSGE